jgi:hypothetical protein
VLPWLNAFLRRRDAFDLCCIVFQGACNPGHEPQDDTMYLQHQCPCFHVYTAHDFSQVIQYTRPNVILTFYSPALSDLLIDRNIIPVAIAPPDPEAGAENWVKWLQYLSAEQ